MDLQNKKVVQSNTLIKAIAKMDALPLKLFELAVANVDTKEKDPEVELEKDLIRTFLPRTNALRHDYLQTIMTNLMDKSTFTVKYTKENGKKKTEIFAPFSKIEFSEDESTVKLSFSNKIMPYITELKKNFTQYRIEDLRHFTSSNTITIYKVLMMYYNQYTNYIANGKRTKEELESFLNPVIDVSELKALTVQGKKSYDRFSDLKKRVIEPAIKDINEHSTMKVSYETDGAKGKKVTEITFICVDNILLPNADDKVKKALEELLYYKVNKNVALDIVKKFSFERIENNIQYIITTYPKKDKKKEYPKLIVTAIKENFAGESWGLQSIDDDKVEKDKEELEKSSKEYDDFIKKIKTDEEAEKIIKYVLENTESTLLLNQLNTLQINYKPMEIVNNKLFKSIAMLLMKNGNIF